MTDHTQLTEREQYRHAVITRLIAGELVNGQVATMLRLSSRQVTRLKRAILLRGIKAVIHKLKGKPSNHRIVQTTKEEIIQLVKQHYADFKPLFASEKLQERHGIVVNPETLRLWMTSSGLWKPRTHKKRGIYRSWRPRKEYYGELQQFDGSYHDWFEGRYTNWQGHSIETCLLTAIDDATGKITHAEFAPHEGVVPVFQFWKTYLLALGKPLGVYLDKFSTYKINHKNAVDNHDLMTQFQRATIDLNVELITAHSPQAKGRVERLYGTLQDRLIKEMRLAGIDNPEDGTIFLHDIFIPTFNEKFAVVPEKEGDAHCSLTASDTKDFNRIFSVQSHRTVNNDFTIQFKNRWFQLQELQPTTVRAKEKILMEEWLDGSIHMSLRGHDLNYFALPKKPEKINIQPALLTTHCLNWKPPANHPWRKYRLSKG